MFVLVFGVCVFVSTYVLSLCDLVLRVGMFMYINMCSCLCALCVCMFLLCVYASSYEYLFCVKVFLHFVCYLFNERKQIHHIKNSTITLNQKHP